MNRTEQNFNSVSSQLPLISRKQKHLLESPRSRRIMNKLKINPNEASTLLKSFGSLDMDRSNFALKTICAPQSTKNHFNFEKNKIRVLNFYKKKLDPNTCPASKRTSIAILSGECTSPQSFTNFNSTAINLSKNSSEENDQNVSFSFTNNLNTTNHSKYSQFPKINQRYI